MRKHCYGTGEQERRECAEPVSESIKRSLGGVIAMSNELEEKLAQVKNCPAPCRDGKVTITLESGQTRKMPCPILASGCQCLYGELMGQGFERYVTGVMSGIGVPLRHVEKLHNACSTERLHEIAKWPVRGFLIFTGVTGSGKSFGAAWAVYKYLAGLVLNYFDRRKWEAAERASKSILWCASADICEDREIAARVKREYLAVIDDFGGEADSSAGRSTICGVILRRYDMKLPTVITTALTLPDIDIRYGGRVSDRLAGDVGDADGSMIIECGDVSLRNPAAYYSALEK